MEETRRWFEAGVVLTDAVKEPSRGTALEELTKMVRASRLHMPEGTAGDKLATESLRPINDVCGAMRSATLEGIARISHKHSKAMWCTCGMGKCTRVKLEWP